MGANLEEIRIKIDEDVDRGELFGSYDAYLQLIIEAFEIIIVQRDNELIIKGENSEIAKKVLEELIGILKIEHKIDVQKVNYVIDLAKKGVSYKDSNIHRDTICFTHKGKPLKPKTIGQMNYASSIRNKDMVFGVGPAGTGKTYIAVAMAINAYKNKEVQKIILARPAVEAGERLGFLPGDLQEKIDPYLRPIYDALYDILGKESTIRLKEKEIIEIIPLAYMRGRTLDNSFIILDEAQNTTKEQMKMFLTRLGFGSKAVINGDITQIDLPIGKKSGLIEVMSILKDIPEIDFCMLTDADVVRHDLVRKIVLAYSQFYKQNSEREEE